MMIVQHLRYSHLSIYFYSYLANNLKFCVTPPKNANRCFWLLSRDPIYVWNYVTRTALVSMLFPLQ